MSDSYDPKTFKALTFHDAVPSFRDGSDTPRAYLERCLETVADREAVVKAYVVLNEDGARAAADAAPCWPCLLRICATRSSSCWRERRSATAALPSGRGAEGGALGGAEVRADEGMGTGGAAVSCEYEPDAARWRPPPSASRGGEAGRTSEASCRRSSTASCSKSRGQGPLKVGGKGL